MMEIQLDVEKLNSDEVYEFSHNGLKRKLHVRKLVGKFFYSFDGLSWTKLTMLSSTDVVISNSETLKVYRGFKPSGLSKNSSGAMVTQMPGKVVKVLKKIGDSVQKGDTVVILEAMKMENEIKTSIDGVIKSINVQEGQTLESGVLMVDIEASPS
jgi:biotin carboxyl carrier protein